MTARWAFTSGAIVLAVLSLLYVATRVKLDSDYSAFLPHGATKTQRAFMSEIRDGVASRIMLIELSGSTTQELARVSGQLAGNLSASPAFRYVSNGGTTFGQRELGLLERNRYVLSDAIETPGHFSRDGLRAALEQRLAGLAGSAGFLDKHFLARDPTGEMFRLLQRMTPSSAPRRQHGVWFDASGARALLLAETRAAGSDLTGQQASLAALQEAFAAADPSGKIAIEYSSPGAMAVASRTLIASDARALMIASVVLVVMILAWVYRSFPVVVLCILPALAGLLVGVAAVNAAFGSVHGIALAFGATLLGEAVDYPSYLLTRVRRDVSIATVKKNFGRTLRLVVLTTAFGSLALLASGFPGLAQLGMLTLVGVLVAGIVTWWVVPYWIPATWVPALKSDQGTWTPLIRAPRWLRWGVVLCAGMFLAVSASSRSWWDDDLATMNPLPASFKERDARLRAAIGAPDAGYMLLLGGVTQDEALRNSESLRPVLQQWVADGAIGGFDLVSDYLPSPTTQARRRAALPTDDALRRDLAAALAGLPFREGTFEPFLQDVAQARMSANLSAAEYAGSALGLKTESLLRRSDDGWHVVVPLRSVRDATALRASLGRVGTTHAELLDLRAESVAMLAAYRQRAVVSSLVGVALICALLAVGLRSLRRAVRVAIPVLLAVAFTAAILVAAGTPLSIFHLVALLLTLGVGVNYALLIEHGATEGDAAANVWRTLAVVSGTALCTFGLLALSSAPVLHAIGATVSIGVVLSLLIGALLIEPSRISA